MDLVQNLKENTEAFIALVNTFSDKDFNKKPDDDTWSAAENTEHIIRSEFGTARLFSGETEAAPDRDSATLIADIEKAFLNREEKYRSFGVVNPTTGEKNKEELLKKFMEMRKEVLELIQHQNLDELCVKFEHPVYGYLTRREWVRFNIVHAKRHMMQMEELKQKI